MNAFLILWNKEWTEVIRTSKIIWLPAVFLLLGIAQPVTAKFMPDILKSAGSLPEGTVIQIPLAQPGEVLSQTLNQFGSIGVLALCLAFMGMLSGERKSGTAAWVLVKPVSPLAYVISKWAVSTMLTLGSFGLGYAAACYETEVLIGTPDTGQALAGGAAYAGWLVFVTAAVLTAGAWFNAPAAAAFVTFAGVTVLQLVQVFFGDKLQALPSGLAGEAISALSSHAFPSVTAAGFTTAAVLIALICFTVWGVRSKPLKV